MSKPETNKIECSHCPSCGHSKRSAFLNVGGLCDECSGSPERKKGRCAKCGCKPETCRKFFCGAEEVKSGN